MPRIRLTRDSVAAGDDCDAPHEQRITVLETASLLQVLSGASQDYLARIAGGKATWVAEAASVPLAVIAQQWREPVLLPAGMAHAGIPQEIHFQYLMQEKPEQVVARLREQGEHNHSLKADGSDRPAHPSWP